MKELDREALEYLVTEHGFMALKLDEYDELQRFITEDEIVNVYRKEEVYDQLTFDDQFAILTQYIYEEKYGIPVIDQLLYQSIDEISSGTVGLPNDEIPPSKSLEKKRVRKAYETVNIKVRSAQIKLKFMSFKSWDGLEEVCKKLASHNPANTLNNKEPRLLGYRRDGSRITIMKPPLSECFGFFYRLFPDNDTSLKELVSGKKGDIKGTDLLLQVESLLAKTVSLVICGAQGAGKTTKLVGLVEFYYPWKELRVIEATLEAWLRRKFIGRDIFTMTPTEFISNSEVYELSLRTSGLITLLTELRSHEMRVKVIEASNKGSEYNQFTSHEMDPEKVPESLAESFLVKGIYSHLSDALRVVLKAIPIAIKVDVDEKTGNRYYSIYEYVQDELKIGFPNLDSSSDTEIGKLIGLAKEYLKMSHDYYVKATSPIRFRAVPIVVFDQDLREYVIKNKLSKKLYEKIRLSLIYDDERKLLDKLLKPDDEMEVKI